MSKSIKQIVGEIYKIREKVEKELDKLTKLAAALSEKEEITVVGVRSNNSTYSYISDDKEEAAKVFKILEADPQFKQVFYKL